MRLSRIGITCIAVINLAVFAPVTVLPAVEALAQTTASRKAEVDRLEQQGAQQLGTSQFQAALQTFQQELAICREIKDRECIQHLREKCP